MVACVGGGSNAIGIFDAFIDDRSVRLIGVEAGGERIARGRHAARFAGGSAGVLQGTRTFVLQDDDGNIELTHSISAGLDYAAVGPEHAWLRAQGRTEYVHVSDADALAAFQTLARLEGILPALESSHAVAYAQTLAARARTRRGRSSSTSRAAETRTCIRWRSILGSRIAERFDGLRTARQTGPGHVRHGRRSRSGASAEILKALDRAGADVLEVGVPFSDPLADGPVIQRATERALAAGSNLRESLALVERIRPSVSAPMVMFSYANPMLRMGVDAFARRAAAAGVDGVLALDLPIEEAAEFRETLAAAGARYDIPVEPDHHRRAHPTGWLRSGGDFFTGFHALA